MALIDNRRSCFDRLSMAPFFVAGCGPDHLPGGRAGKKWWASFTPARHPVMTEIAVFDICPGAEARPEQGLRRKAQRCKLTSAHHVPSWC
jgi:hypothetical protein